MTRTANRVNLWLSLVAATVFSAYAASFLYFFVDDEAIPFIYARNLLRGRGLVYGLSEGRVEGYSDFLHVLWSTVILLVTRAASLPRLAALDIGKAVSFVLGIGVVLLAARMMREARASMPGQICGLVFLALSGPLAVWSCSSLETVPFAFALTALALLALTSSLKTGPMIALATILVLYRIDGFVYVGAILVAAVVQAPPDRRRWLVLRFAVPVGLIAAVYHAARFAYFGTLVSAPLEAKVLYKLMPTKGLIVKAPDHSYLWGFGDLYGVAIAPCLGLAMIAAWRSRIGRGAVVAALLMSAYASIVGDWMFGWRFIVPVLPLLALIIAIAVSGLRNRAVWSVVALVCVWSGVGARAFAIEYTVTEDRPLWWVSPHEGEAVWLHPYGSLLAEARKAISRGDTIAYNQAGLLPFVLDVENVDDLGICSSFEAGLPTTDVYFTEVGRYSPLTNSPVFSASDAYLLYRHVRVIVTRMDLLTNANGGQVPRQLLGGYYALAAIDPEGENALYVRTEKRADEFRRNPALFEENLAHTSRLKRVNIDGVRLPDASIGPALPFLRWQTGLVPIHRAKRIDILFADHDEDVSTLYVGSLSATSAVALTLNLYDESGRMVESEDAQPDPSPAPLLRTFPAGTRARLLSLEMRSAASDATLSITDLRVNGQSAALRDYVRRTLRFPVK